MAWSDEYTWENQDELSLPKVESAKSPFGSEASAALQKKSEYEKRRPREEAYKPKWWQTLIAGATAGLGNYIDMGGRTRVPAGQTAKVVDEFSRPGYKQAMRSWEEEGAGVESDLDTAMKKAQMDYQGRNLASQESLRRKQEEQAVSATEFNRARAKAALTPKPPTPTVLSPGAALMGPDNKPLYTNPTAPRPPAPPRLSAESVLLDPNATPDRKTEARRILSVLHPGRNDGPKPAGPAQFALIERTKQNRLADAEQAHVTRTRLSKEPMDEATSRQLLEAEKKRILAAYDAEIMAAGGSVGPSVPAAGPPPPPPPNPYRTQPQPR